VKLKTTADLRTALLESIEQVRSREMEPKQAQAICNLTKEVIKTAEIEIKATLMAHEVGIKGAQPEPLRLTSDD